MWSPTMRLDYERPDKAGKEKKIKNKDIMNILLFLLPVEIVLSNSSQINFSA